MLHITSLPGPYGIGDLGPAAHRFVDLLAASGQTWWQMLPLGPGDCPYQCVSAMAGNPNLINPELLRRDGLLQIRDLRPPLMAKDWVDFEQVTAHKRAMLGRAWEGFQSSHSTSLHCDFEKFQKSQASWLEDFSLFQALKTRFDSKPWAQWPADLVRRKERAMDEACRALVNDIRKIQFAQFLFFRQLDELRKHAASKAVKLIGDLPIFVSGDSADVWSHPELFLLDKNYQPTVVAGVPPDYFSATGQRWGNPLYNWPAMKRDDFRWWIDRAKMALRQADLVRIDHFRGFAASWAIPASSPTAQKGKWMKSPGAELFSALRTELGGLPFIAEDLGVITPDVEALRDQFHLPGMRVLQFAFGGDANNPFLPHNYVRNCIAYTGTHDNDTTAGWLKSLGRKERGHLKRYAPETARERVKTMIRLVWSSVADVAIAPLQDVLQLGSDARMNSPGTSSGNWAWRARDKMLSPRNFEWLAEVTATYGRIRE